MNKQIITKMNATSNAVHFFPGNVRALMQMVPWRKHEDYSATRNNWLTNQNLLLCSKIPLDECFI